jgi:prepilin-type N-terminal cleavage/methylation domain-containing protein
VSTPERGEEGMTLIELLIAISLMAIIMVPLTGGLYLALVTNSGTIQRTTDTSGGQLMSSFLVPDVQSADTVASAAPFVCAQGTTFLELGSFDAATGAQTEVSYNIVPQGAPSMDDEVTRSTYSVDGGTCMSTSSSVVVRAALSPTLRDPNPIVTCTPSPCGPTTRSVAVTLIALSKSVTSRSYYSGYTFQLSATRRVAG